MVSGKNKKGKKPKAQNKPEVSKAFSVDFGVISKFGNVHVSPPTAPELLDSTIEELSHKMKKYDEEGS